MWAMPWPGKSEESISITIGAKGAAADCIFAVRARVHTRGMLGVKREILNFISFFE